MYYYMIVLLSIFLLFVLVWLGMKPREGMTINTASSLIKQLGIYYDIAVNNRSTNTDNKNNEETTYQNILNLHLTDAKYNAVITNKNLDEFSKINMINNMLVNDVTSEGNASITIDQFQQILTVYNDTNLNNTEKVVEITNITSADPRFSFLRGNPSVTKDADKLTAIQNQILSILNSP